MNTDNLNNSMNQLNFELKTPKGTRDFGPAEMAVRQKLFSTITDIFKRFGAVTIETPAFELRQVLRGKYGEDSKLIYDLEDQGGELCSLRYDQTVPFARYLGMNKSVKGIKRYQIGKVFRRDQPVLSKGRYREFYQCDYDIAGGNYEPMVPDAEVLKVIQTVLKAVLPGEDGKKDFVIKINSRKILDGIFELAGVPEDQLRKVCSAVDKLDKATWEEVRKEMIEEKNVDPKAADEIGSWVLRRGKVELVEELLKSKLAEGSPKAKEGLEELKVLFGFLDLFQVTEDVVFDMSLARGLDYYTGIIFEAVLTGEDVGSVAGGGRYDKLVGMFSKSGEDIPCVGVAIGIERIYTILEARAAREGKPIKSTPAQVFVSAVGEDLLEERMALVNELRMAGISADFMAKRKVKALDQFAYCEKNLIPLAVIIGPDELKQGLVKLRDVAGRCDETIPKSDLISVLKTKIALLDE